MKRRFLFLALVLLLGSEAAAGEFWLEKDFRQWSEKECRKLLEDSPWARTYVLSRPFIEPVGTPTGERVHEASPRIEYRVQFRSALPVRQALVRLAQLQENYGALSAEERQRFDTESEKFLAASFPDTVLVHVAFSSNVPLYEQDLVRNWRSHTTDVLRNAVFLSGGKDKTARLLEFSMEEPQQQSFLLAFPRHQEGQPLISPADKRLVLEFIHPRIGVFDQTRVLMEFSARKMVVQDAVVY